MFRWQKTFTEEGCLPLFSPKENQLVPGYKFKCIYSSFFLLNLEYTHLFLNECLS